MAHFGGDEAKKPDLHQIQNAVDPEELKAFVEGQQKAQLGQCPPRLAHGVESFPACTDQI